MQTYSELLERLFSINQQNGMKFGLSNTEALCAALGNIEKQLPCIHVAGSNGKGSVTTKIAACLQLQGLRVGRYTSPHIATFRERICIDGEMIEESTVIELLNRIFAIIDSQNIQATFFEITTALALLYFSEQRIDIAVLEAGLGGRLDSTNVVDPLVSVITSISLDHTEILGNTIEAIAKEKAGIIKPGRPVVIGPRVPLAIIAPVAQAKNATCLQVTGVFDDFDAENSAVAKCCLQLLKVSEELINQGILSRPPCRLENIPLNLLHKEERPLALILDVAHNPDGIEQLLAAVHKRFPGLPLRIVCGLSKSKDLKACATLLARNGSPVHCIEADNPRALPSIELFEALKIAGLSESKLFIKESLLENLRLTLQIAHQQQEIVVICGTFFIMAQVKDYCGITTSQDNFMLNEIHHPLEASVFRLQRQNFK